MTRSLLIKIRLFPQHWLNRSAQLSSLFCSLSILNSVCSLCTPWLIATSIYALCYSFILFSFMYLISIIVHGDCFYHCYSKKMLVKETLIIVFKVTIHPKINHNHRDVWFLSKIMKLDGALLVVLKATKNKTKQNKMKLN